MKVRGDRSHLVDSLGNIIGIVPSSTTKPILLDLLLSTESGGLVAEATDLEIAGRTSIHKVEVLEEGTVALPCARLMSMLKEIPDELVTITSRDDPPGAVLDSKGFEFKILGHDPEEFPKTSRPETPNTFVISRERLYESLKRVAVATSRDETRYQLNGVFLEFEKETLLLSATDGKRLTHDSIRMDNAGDAQISAILPNQAVDVFLRVLSSPGVQEDSVTLSLSETDVSLQTADVLITSNLVEGMYPNYRAVFPPQVNMRVKADRGALMAACRSASLTTDKKTSTVAFRVVADSLVLESNAQDVGESHIEIPVEVSGSLAEMDIRFNPVFFIDALRTIEEDEITIEIMDRSKPATLRGAHNYRHLLMPLVLK